ncbi:MAG: stage II sporulation protein E [Chloroflexi bacterium RBG_19FT_COMBO_48_23]|nr:MAG: stage II sporulation protein E [Chloroflexi bacterium RBG_19FT_COMBO_48_23]
MDVSIASILIDLIKTACVVVAFAYVLTRTGFFAQILDKKFSFKNQAILILLFGALSVFGTYGGLILPSGAIANIRDLGPMVAGLVGGPVVGLGAGLIGGLHRYFLGGFVCIPCALSTVIAGLLGGAIYRLKRGEFVAVWQAILFAIFMESLHMGLTLLIAKPYEQALGVVKEVILPMTGANALGMAIFAFIIRNLITERRTAEEKESYRRELERTEYEMETARGIQQSFLPESPPIIEGFELAALNLPARQVGGDFYDFIPVSEGKWGIIIADVSGKGVPAALFMALSRTLVRANVADNPTASQAMQKANRLISQEAKMGMFVTLFYAVLDPKKRRLQYVNAGHNPPFVVKKSSGDVILLRASGIAMGVIDDVSLEEKEIELDSNDIVVFYTDGITEAINSAGEQFGEKRLVETINRNADLPVKDLVGRVKDEVFTFAQDQPQFDDFTLVILKAT